MLQRANNLATKAPQRPNQDKLNIKILDLNYTRQCIHIFSITEKANYYARDLKQYICENIKEKLRHMRSNVQFNCIDTSCINLAKNTFRDH